MINEFEPVTRELMILLKQWEPGLLEVSDTVLSQRGNSQHRTIKLILGHIMDSATNNTHRIVHLQYQKSPLTYPNYATEGNIDRWIAIQNYQEENWTDMIQLWKHLHLHLVHVIMNINPAKLDNKWNSEPDHGNVTLRDMVVHFLRHFKLHLGEIEELMSRKD